MSTARPHWRPAYVGIGSNLSEPLRQVRRAIEELKQLPDSMLVAVSPLYRSAPMGPPDQPDYINAVVALLTQMSADSFLVRLAQIEERHGRHRDVERWGPRTLDLDLLVFGADQVSDPGLTLPHPGISTRNFVLLPLHDVAPQLTVPGLGSVSSLVAALGRESPRIEKIADEPWM